MKKKSKNSKAVIWVASAGVALFLVAVVAAVVVISTSDSITRKRRSAQTVTLIKPPPPLKEKEKPPEPEVKKEPVEQKVKEVELREIPAETAQPDKGPDQSANQDLGVDSEGSAGSDGFGLVGRKGGTPLTIGGGEGGGGGGEGASLMAKYGWYTNMLQEELRKKVMDKLGRQKGIPRGKHETVVKVTVQGDGRIGDFTIVGSSGISAVDEAVREALVASKLSEPPPAGMPRAMKIRISSQG